MKPFLEPVFIFFAICFLTTSKACPLWSPSSIPKPTTSITQEEYTTPKNSGTDINARSIEEFDYKKNPKNDTFKVEKMYVIISAGINTSFFNNKKYYRNIDFTNQYYSLLYSMFQIKPIGITFNIPLYKHHRLFLGTEFSYCYIKQTDKLKIASYSGGGSGGPVFAQYNTIFKTYYDIYFNLSLPIQYGYSFSLKKTLRRVIPFIGWDSELKFFYHNNDTYDYPYIISGAKAATTLYSGYVQAGCKFVLKHLYFDLSYKYCVTDYFNNYRGLKPHVVSFNLGYIF